MACLKIGYFILADSCFIMFHPIFPMMTQPQRWRVLPRCPRCYRSDLPFVHPRREAPHLRESLCSSGPPRRELPPRPAKRGASWMFPAFAIEHHMTYSILSLHIYIYIYIYIYIFIHYNNITILTIISQICKISLLLPCLATHEITKFSLR